MFKLHIIVPPNPSKSSSGSQITPPERRFLMITNKNRALHLIADEIKEQFTKLYPDEDPLIVQMLQNSEGFDLDWTYILSSVLSESNTILRVSRGEEEEDSNPRKRIRSASVRVSRKNPNNYREVSRVTRSTSFMTKNIFPDDHPVEANKRAELIEDDFENELISNSTELEDDEEEDLEDSDSDNETPEEEDDDYEENENTLEEDTTAICAGGFIKTNRDERIPMNDDDSFANSPIRRRAARRAALEDKKRSFCTSESTDTVSSENEFTPTRASRDFDGKHLHLRIGDEVYIDLESLERVPQGLEELATRERPRFPGPFRVIRHESSVIVHLDLPQQAAKRYGKLYHVNDLRTKKYVEENFPTARPSRGTGRFEFHNKTSGSMEVESIRRHTQKGRGFQFEVLLCDGSLEFKSGTELERTAPDLLQDYAIQFGITRYIS